MRHKFAAALTAYVLGASLAYAQPEVEIEFITSFGGFGKTEPGKFDWVAGIALDGQGLIIVADNENHRVQRCNTQGECEVFGKRGEQLGEFVWPLGVAVDSLGRIIVSEAGNDRIQLLDSGGNWTSFGTTGRVAIGEFRLPAGLDKDDQDRIVIADEKNHRIQICDLTGACAAFGEFGSGPGQFNGPQAVDVDDQNRIYVGELDNHRVQIFQATYADDPPPPGSFQINAGLNDAWFNTATNGQGFLITVFPDIKEMFLAWFTFDTERPPEDVSAFLGEPGHRWLTAQGPYDGDTATLTIYVTEGGVFDAAAPSAETDLAGDGTITLEFADCSAGLVNYEITSLGISGEIPIQRIVEDNVPLCEALVDQSL